MIDPTISASLDANGKDISSLRRSAKENSPEALKGALKQFEALFVNMMLKSMRNATPQDGIFDSEQTKMYTSMLDQELSQNFAKRGIGLADAMLRQMTRNGAVVTPDSGAQKADAGGGVSSAPDSATSSASAPFSVAEIVREGVPGPVCIRCRRGEPHNRHTGQVHAGSGCLGKRMGKKGNKGCRRYEQSQPFWHQGG